MTGTVKRGQISVAAQHLKKMHSYLVTRVEAGLDEASRLARKAASTRNPEEKARHYREAYHALRQLLLEAKQYLDYHTLKTIQALERATQTSLIPPEPELESASKLKDKEKPA